MLHVRTVVTASNATAVQVVRYHLRKRIIVKHIGSARSADKLAELHQTAHQWINTANQQQHLFDPPPKSTLVALDKLRNLGFRYAFAQEVITGLFELFRFPREDPLLLDLVMMRILHPASKRESVELLAEWFGISHQRTTWYQSIPSIITQKDAIERAVISVAKIHYAFDFSIVFYDVTTLYFESFAADEDSDDVKGLRKNGFSKDGKSNQPQIVIGLIVNADGFPVSYEIFEGSTFEGKTFIPIISRFKERHQIAILTVVADAAMISLDNVKKLREKDLSYIVGARVANLTRAQITDISTKLNQIDRASIRIETKRGLLICDFSQKRYRKDKREMDKQIAKAEKFLKDPSSPKRTKFLKNKQKGKVAQILNTSQIDKTKLLLGIKGYYTNLTTEPDSTIISQYHALWHVELAFRIAKSDLAMRPIYHHKRQAIEAHILLCFMALAVCKYMELKTKRSTKAIIKLLTQVTDARLLNTLANEEIVIRSEVSPETQKLVEDLSLSH